MPVQVRMPALSPTMTEGKIARWLKKEGDKVKSGDTLAEIETDKATMEVEAVEEGTLGKILVPGGTENVQVNTPIAVILEEGEDKSALANISTAAAAAAPKAAAPAAPAAPLAPKPAVAQASASVSIPSQSKTNGGERIFVSPLARRLAQEKGIDLGGITGSGPHGRIVKADIDAARGSPQARTGTRAPGASPVVLGPTPHRVVPHTSVRKIIARRLTEAKSTIPHFYLTVDCEIDALLKGRAALNAQAKDGEGAYKLSVNDFVIKAVALALQKIPEANASWSDEGVVRYEREDISIAVATPAGLITPIIWDAGSKGLIQISNEMKELGQRAREGRLKPQEFQGGTFSISNLGMYGIKQFEAIINPPQACILAVGAGEQRPVVRNGVLAVATVMSCTLSVDHRVVDGAIGAEFLGAFKRLIEEPLGMLL